jgi:putative membrane protein insertion efficiency factor
MGHDTRTAMIPRLFLIGILLIASLENCLVRGACQSCLHAPLYRRVHHHHHHHVIPSAVARSLQRGSTTSSLRTTFLGFLTMKSLQRSVVTPITFAIGVTLAQRYVANVLLRASEQDAAKTTDDLDGDDKEAVGEDDDKPVSSAMVATIGIYKNFISPLLPPACRFLPTCSQYGVQAIEEFGPTKGSVLTAWRLMRCSPFGGKGYDPPRWPPVAYTHSSY